MDTPAPTQFWVKISGTVYGPYGPERMNAFIAEGRIRASTRITKSLDGEGDWRPAGMVAEFVREFKPSDVDADAKSNLIVYAELFSRSALSVEMALSALGDVTQIAANLYALHTRASIAQVRDLLAKQNRPSDRLLIIDASRDRALWANLGPETEARLRTHWRSHANA